MSLSPYSSNRERKRRELGPAGAYCEYHVWISSRVCAVAGRRTQTLPCGGETHGHHVRPVGAGYGDLVVIDGELRGNEIPFCYKHHSQLEDVLGPRGFEEKHEVGVYYLARLYGAEVCARPLESFCRDEWLEAWRAGIDPS